jgi:hypothetical protein
MSAWFAGYVRSPLVSHELVAWDAQGLLIVVCFGQAYLCSASGDNVLVRPVDVQPTTALAVTPDQDAVILADFTNLHKFSPSGERLWISDQVSYDGIRSLTVSSAGCTLEGWDAPGRRFVPVSVNLATGHASGSPHYSARDR